MIAPKSAAQCRASILAKTMASEQVIPFIQKNNSPFEYAFYPSAFSQLTLTQHNSLHKHKFNKQFPNPFLSHMGLTIPHQQNQRRFFKTQQA
jgi:hypothetical protein